MVTEQRRSAFILRIAPRGIDPVPGEGFDRVPEALEMGHLIIGWVRAQGLLNPDLDRDGFRKIIRDEYHPDAETLHGAGRDAGKIRPKSSTASRVAMSRGSPASLQGFRSPSAGWIASK